MVWCASLVAFSAAAQVSVQIGVPAPTVTFVEPPRLVTVEPGVQVVEGYDGEVFFVDGWYWHRSNGYWWRTHDWHGGWAVVEAPYVPRWVARQPTGHWRNYHRAYVAPAPARHYRGQVRVAPPPPPPHAYVPAPRRAPAPAPAAPMRPGHGEGHGRRHR